MKERKFKLIKTYPGHAILGEIYIKNENSPILYKHETIERYILREVIENSPTYWEEVKPLVLPIPMEDYFIYNKGKIIYRLCRTFKDKHSNTIMVVTSFNKGHSTLNYTVKAFIDILHKNPYKVFNTLKEAEEHLIYDAKLLSINEIEKIYKSAKNITYWQSTKLKELILSKL